MFAILKIKGYNRAWKEQIGFKEVNAGDRGILPRESNLGKCRRVDRKSLCIT